jgi:hypothetical protein
VLLPLRTVADPLSEADDRVGAMELDGGATEEGAYCEPRVLTFGIPEDHTLGVTGGVGAVETPDRTEAGGLTHAPRVAAASFLAGGPFTFALMPDAQAAEPTEWTPRCECAQWSPMRIGRAYQLVWQ